MAERLEALQEPVDVIALSHAAHLDSKLLDVKKV